MVLDLGENPLKDVLCQDMLQQHLPDVGLGDRWADAAVTQCEEFRDPVLVGGISDLGIGHCLPQVFQDRWQVRGELVPCLPELTDLGQLVVKETADELVQTGGVGHVDPHRLSAVLEQHRDAGVFEYDVAAWIPAFELALDFGVQVVVGVFGLPKAAGHSQGVKHGAVRDDATRSPQFRHQHQPVPVGGAVGRQAALEGWADVQLVVRATNLDELSQGCVVTVYVRECRHVQSMIHPHQLSLRIFRGTEITGYLEFSCGGFEGWLLLARQDVEGGKRSRNLLMTFAPSARGIQSCMVFNEVDLSFLLVSKDCCPDGIRMASELNSDW